MCSNSTALNGRKNIEKNPKFSFMECQHRYFFCVAGCGAMVRESDSQSEGWGFDSLSGHPVPFHTNGAVRATVLNFPSGTNKGHPCPSNISTFLVKSLMQSLTNICCFLLVGTLQNEQSIRNLKFNTT